jgi:hypothetical protein
MRAHHDVDAIDLQQRDTREDSTKNAPIDAPARSGIGKPLSREGDAARLGKR